MKAIVYYVHLLDDHKDDKRQRQLYSFLDKNTFDIIHTYYDIHVSKQNKEQVGLQNLLQDLADQTIIADAFIAMSVKDIGQRQKLIKTLAEINSHVPMIFFTDIENPQTDDIA
jgi:DNA invertase Pin-like site-specific DNA recombinase